MDEYGRLGPLKPPRHLYDATSHLVTIADAVETGGNGTARDALFSIDLNSWCVHWTACGVVIPITDPCVSANQSISEPQEGSINHPTGTRSVDPGYSILPRVPIHQRCPQGPP